MIRDRLLYIVQKVNDFKDHIPPITKKESAAVFPFEISFSLGDKSDDSSWGLFNMLKQGPPKLMKT